jgi:hypothetical protein
LCAAAWLADPWSTWLSTLEAHMEWPNPRINQIKTRDDLADFLVELSAKVSVGEYPMGHPQSVDLISAAGHWTREMGQYFKNMGEDVPEEAEWALVAEIFCAALVYD